MPRKAIPAEALVDLRQRLNALPPRSPERRVVMQATATLYGVSEPTLYRMLHQHARPRALQHTDQGVPRVLPKAELERYCELIAAIKMRTSNRKGRHLSTAESILLPQRFSSIHYQQS